MNLFQILINNSDFCEESPIDCYFTNYLYSVQPAKNVFPMLKEQYIDKLSLADNLSVLEYNGMSTDMNETNSIQFDLNEIFSEEISQQEKITRLLKILEDKLEVVEIQIKKKNQSSSDSIMLNPNQEKKCLLSLQKKHLSKLWSTRYLASLKSEYRKNYNIDLKEIQSVRKLTQKPNIRIEKLAEILRKSPSLRNMFIKEELNNDHVLLNIFNSNLRVESKYIMIESYPIFKNAVLDPERFVSWDSQMYTKIQASSNLVEKCQGKSYQTIKKIFEDEIAKESDNLKDKKCSRMNNTSYCWGRYIKKIAAQSGFLKLNESHQCQKGIMENLGKKNINIQNIKETIALEPLNQYLRKKIANDQVLNEIITYSKFNIVNKHNMVMSYDIFCKAVKHPSMLNGWLSI